MTADTAEITILPPQHLPNAPPPPAAPCPPPPPPPRPIQPVMNFTLSLNCEFQNRCWTVPSPRHTLNQMNIIIFFTFRIFFFKLSQNSLIQFSKPLAPGPHTVRLIGQFLLCPWKRSELFSQESVF